MSQARAGDSRPREAAAAAARRIEAGFADYHRAFRQVTRKVADGFAERDWRGVRRLTVRRMRLQSQHVAGALLEVRQLLAGAGLEPEARETWALVKAAYSETVLGRDDVELAKTFFNSLARKVFSHVGVEPDIDYQYEEIPLPYAGWEMASARMYAVPEAGPAVVRRLLADAGFRTPFADLEGDARRAAAAMERGIVAAFSTPKIEALDFLTPVFFRNKGAYLVGRARRGAAVLPLVLAILHTDDGLVVDAVLPTEDETSIVFSFARWYFHADVESPREVIGFLHSILPRKRLAELYISLGYTKHGKTEFYRDLVHHVAAAGDRFVEAEGKRGLVMTVFTLPSFQFVFKLIRDRFPPQKPFTRGQVKRQYRQVLTWDRVGRMVDFQEFEYLALPRERFSDELLETLLEAAGDTVHAEADQVVLDHVYVQRRVTPLDLYLSRATPKEAADAVVEYGCCLKDLAAANVFPGDLLLKNFGVTRHGRVVFYDYDEVSTVTELRFRRFPQTRDPYQEMSSEPWFSIEDDDVFPEEMDRFLGLDGEPRRVFEEHHGDLFDVDYWRRTQQALADDEVIDVFPYDEGRRL